MEIMYPKSVDTHKTISRGKAFVLTAGVVVIAGKDSLTIHPITKKGGVNQVCVALPYDSKTLFSVAEVIKKHAMKALEQEIPAIREDVECLRGGVWHMMDTNELIAFCEKHEGMAVKASREFRTGVREEHIVQYKDSRFTDCVDGVMLNDSALKFRLCHITGEHSLPKQWEVTGL